MSRVGATTELTGGACRYEAGQRDPGNPPSTTTRKAYDLTADALGEGFNGPLLLSVELTGDAPAEAHTVTPR